MFQSGLRSYWYVHPILLTGLWLIRIGNGIPTIGQLDEIAGGSAWGASTVAAGDGHLQPTKTDLEVANFQGSVSLSFPAHDPSGDS